MEEYLILEHKYEIVIQQLDAERREVARMREMVDKHRSETLIVRKEADKLSREVCVDPM